MIISVGLMVLCQTLSWFQTNGSLKVDWLKNNVLLLAVLGVPITYFYILATQIGFKGFGNLWAPRLISFSVGIAIFMILTSIFFGESVTTPKNTVTLVLICAVIAIQIFWK